MRIPNPTSGPNVTNAQQLAAAYQFDSAPKPYMHPLLTRAGRCVTRIEPPDHVWHRGLWWTIKFINDENFWEEQPPFGSQRSVTPPVVESESSTTTRLTHALHWVTPGGEVVIDEQRTIRYERDATKPLIRVDWSTRLTPRPEVTLDRTPFTTWGGYGGLSFRAAEDFVNARFITPDGSTPPALLGDAHPWLALDGELTESSNAAVGIAIFDHPCNPRYPTPFYAKSSPGFTFANAAFLFHGPLTLAAGEALALRQRVLVSDGRWDHAMLAAEAKAFVEGGR